MEGVGKPDFRTPPHLRSDKTAVDWSASNEWRYLRDGPRGSAAEERRGKEAPDTDATVDAAADESSKMKMTKDEAATSLDPRATGYHPFRFAAKGAPQTKSQRRMQRRRPDHPWQGDGTIPPQRRQPFKKFVGYAYTLICLYA